MESWHLYLEFWRELSVFLDWQHSFSRSDINSQPNCQPHLALRRVESGLKVLSFSRSEASVVVACIV